MFGTKKIGVITSTENKGLVTLIRRGASYELKNGISLKRGDEVKTATNSYAQITADSHSFITLDENSSIAMYNCEDDKVCMKPITGTTFFEVLPREEMKSFAVTYMDIVIIMSDNALLSFEVFDGTQTAKVYKGSAEVSFSGRTEILLAGEQAVLLQDEDGKSIMDFSRIEPKWISNFLIEELMDKEGTYFSKEELREILKTRENETQIARDAQKEREEAIIKQGGDNIRRGDHFSSCPGTGSIYVYDPNPL